MDYAKKNEKVADVWKKIGKNDQKVAKIAKLATRLASSSLSHPLKVILQQGNDIYGSNMCRDYSWNPSLDCWGLPSG